ncbi:hypothetical protein BDZ91DRAFT_641571, partial [Kalaharituber pfeilii]
LAEYTEKLLAWLSPLEPQKRHQDVQAARMKNTGNWLLQSHQFQSWVKDERSSDSCHVLGCYGKPGAGKTVTASIVIDYVSTIATGSRNSIIYLYCDYRDQKEQSLVYIIGGFSKQLVRQFTST